MNSLKRKHVRHARRRLRVRRKVFGTAERPRLTVFRSNKQIYAQIIDDLAGHTLCAASTREADLKSEVKRGSNKSAAAAVGRVLAARARMKGVRQVAFDRKGYRYHGRIKALADAAREAGLAF
ncbi:MAG: 50S ribosomal protein L18 [Phycisphaerae bacterium]|nr:50S ribosomal protein L18 [Phycisphaerae bacterium]